MILIRKMSRPVEPAEEGLLRMVVGKKAIGIPWSEVLRGVAWAAQRDADFRADLEEILAEQKATT